MYSSVASSHRVCHLRICQHMPAPSAVCKSIIKPRHLHDLQFQCKCSQTDDTSMSGSDALCCATIAILYTGTASYQIWPGSAGVVLLRLSECIPRAPCRTPDMPASTVLHLPNDSLSHEQPCMGGLLSAHSLAFTDKVIICWQTSNELLLHQPIDDPAVTPCSWASTMTYMSCRAGIDF